MPQTRLHTLKSLSLGAGSFLLTPFLNQVQLQAAGNASALPKRFVFVVKSSCIVPEGITPEPFAGENARNE